MTRHSQVCFGIVTLVPEPCLNFHVLLVGKGRRIRHGSWVQKCRKSVESRCLYGSFPEPSRLRGWSLQSERCNWRQTKNTGGNTSKLAIAYIDRCGDTHQECYNGSQSESHTHIYIYIYCNHDRKFRRILLPNNRLSVPGKP